MARLRHHPLDTRAPALEVHPAPSPAAGALFTVVVPSWNNLPFLRLCLESIRKNSSAPHQIVVHVNEGSDGSLEWVRSQGIDYTFTAENAGICFPVNAAAALARTDYVVYMNDDMYACPGWDSALLEAVRAVGHDRFMLSGTMIEPGGKTPGSIVPHDFGGDPGSFREADLLAELPTLVRPDWAGATSPPTLVHRRLWEMVGGYSVEFTPGMGTDPDLAMKLWLAGVREFRGVGRSRVYHFRHKSVGRDIALNDDSRQFALKYGIPISYFLWDVLRWGEPYAGPAAEIPSDLKYRWARVRGYRYRFTP